jgi:hypothetical protein
VQEVRAVGVKLGVPGALARLTDPDLRWAVVFDTGRWLPSQPPAGSEWDYEPFSSLEMARVGFAAQRPGESAYELWEKREGSWHQVEPTP